MREIKDNGEYGYYGELTDGRQIKYYILQSPVNFGISAYKSIYFTDYELQTC